ncbi:hypothetical protein QAD02_000237 [Eretmocerus hayati]|uniref:Uncharacterized protein n=1 Tax=Eretmocerus hayati TaxID=131215 RepID=A0ACC2NCZ7_9HYME|nr:hypothetical protein QAD02_000237 [Eretmocerus hayati]
MAETEGKKLTELRVIDLKTELERRGLDKTGNKAALLDRLAKSIIDEGYDPEEYLIVPFGATKPPPKKVVVEPPMDSPKPSEPASNENSTEAPQEKEDEVSQDGVESVHTDGHMSNGDSKEVCDETSKEVCDDTSKEVCDDTQHEAPEEVEPVIHEETEHDAPGNKETDVHVEDSAVENEADNDYIDVEEAENPVPDATDTTGEEPMLHISTHPEELDMELDPGQNEALNYEENDPEDEMQINEVVDEPFEPSVEESSNVSVIENNGVDNEDSINLDIGEDEECLLGEETESTDRSKDAVVKKKTEDSNDSDGTTSSSNKKGDSKESGKAENDASNKEEVPAETAPEPVAPGVKSDPEPDGSKSDETPITKSDQKDEKEKSAPPAANAGSRNLWVSGLSSTTRATDLKQIFSKFGKVIGAKVVTNARTPGARCYGYVTMSTSEDAEKCIENLHRTELHGRVISVEKAKGDATSQGQNRKREASVKSDKKDDKSGKESDKGVKKTDAEKKNDESAKSGTEKESGSVSADKEKQDSPDAKDEDCDSRSVKSNRSKKSDRDRDTSREDKKRSWDRRTRSPRSKSAERPNKDNEERERQRQREKERLMRDEKRRRREDIERQRAIEREAARLEREREKLRMERERIEQEKAELLRLERERQKLEREKLDRDRQELKKQQMRLEERRPPPPGSAMKRGTQERYEQPERKRFAPEHPGRRHSPPERERRTDVMERIERRVERYDGRSKDGPIPKGGFKRPTEFSSRGRDVYAEAPRGREGPPVRRDARPGPPVDHRPGKDRFDSRATAYVREREVHRPDDSYRGSRDGHTRYESKPPGPRKAFPSEGRYVENARPSGWHSGPPSKPFHSSEQSGWNSRSTDSRPGARWNNSSNSTGHPRPQVHQQQYGNQSYNRYEPYKGSMQSTRKY